MTQVRAVHVFVCYATCAVHIEVNWFCHLTRRSMSITGLCGRGCARFGARSVDGANSTNHSMVNQERLEPRRKPGIKLGHRPENPQVRKALDVMNERRLRCELDKRFVDKNLR